MPLRAIGPIFAQVHGTAAPKVVALHGWGRRGADFDAVLAARDAVALDLPGFGATPPPAAGMGAAGYASMVAESLDELGTGPYVVVGHSFGGRVATVLAARRPDLVDGLVLTGVPLLRKATVSLPPLRYRMLRSANRIGLVSDERMERERRSRGSADYRAATGVMRDVLVTVVNESYDGELAELRCPVELVWGADDADVPVAVAEQAREIIVAAGGRVSLAVLNGVGHFTPTSAPDELRAAIDRVSP
jgi:pimeloyl-ACP methyl ester carboxylesterase